MDHRQLIDDVIQLFSKYPAVWIGISVGSVLLFVGTLVAVPIICVKLPSDYFVHAASPRSMWMLVARTFLAAILIAAGVAMLVLPGQGILTILIGVSLLDFPAKRAWQMRLLQRPTVLRTLNGIRSRAGKPPLET